MDLKAAESSEIISDRRNETMPLHAERDQSAAFKAELMHILPKEASEVIIQTQLASELTSPNNSHYKLPSPRLVSMVNINKQLNLEEFRMQNKIKAPITHGFHTESKNAKIPHNLYQMAKEGSASKL